jgi:hypothetical protein
MATELPDKMVDDLGDETKLWSVDGVVGMGTRTPGGVQRTLGEIVDRLQQVYCGRIAYEYMHLPVSCLCLSILARDHRFDEGALREISN